MVYRFEEFLVNSREYILLKDGEPIRLSPKSFEVLQLLLEHHGCLVSKDEIMEQVWKDTMVEVGRLASCVQEIRTALGDHARAPRWIETVHKRGYRFIGAVVEQTDAAAAAAGADAAVHETEAAPAAPLPAMPDLRPAPAPARRNPLPWVALLALAFSGILATFVFLRQNHPEPPPLILSSRQLTHTSHSKLTFATVPGGAAAWFSEQHGHLQVWRLALDTGSAQPFFADSAANAMVQDVSRDGRRLLLTRFANLSQQPSTALWEMPTGGRGAPHLLVPNGWSGAWSPDGKQLAFSLWGDHGVYLSDQAGGHPRRIAQASGYPWGIRWSPDGHHLVFTSVTVPDLATLSPEGILYRVDLLNRAVTTIRTHAGQPVLGSNPVFETNGRTIAYTHREGDVANVWAIDPRTGRQQAITSGPSNTRLVAAGPSPNQLVTAGEIPHTRLLEISGRGATPQPVLPGLETRDLAFSPDGRWLAWAGLDGTLWQARADGTLPVQLLPAQWKASLPVWSPDSRQLIVSAAPQGGPKKLYRLPRAGDRAHPQPQAITSGPGDDADANWSADQQYILFSRTIARVPQLEWLDLATGAVQPIPDSRGKASPRLSRDGVLSAVSANGDTLFLRRGLTAPWQSILTDRSGLGYNLWSRDGRSLYVLTQTPTATWKRYDLATGSLTAVADLSALPLATGPWYCFALTAQDHLVLSESSNDSEFFLLTLGPSQ